MFFLLCVSANAVQTNPLGIYLTADFLCAIITVLGSVVTVSYTYYKTQKMKRFDVFFSHKASAYENFWIAMANYIDHKTEENTKNLYCAVQRAGLYSSKDTFNQISKLSALLMKNSGDISDCITETAMLMRKDLNRAKNGKLH